ncbi:MAG: hypothetical protein QOE79_1704 [Sphingomonadales bacterium]|jgi:hypothetical protein|nr:hypothetical protein [Sphingomonadales bacterium]MEA3048518.1 hypothetical protein [Sphingomonadales bacterium]
MGIVTFNFNQATIESSNCRIQVSNGTFGLDPNNPVSISGTVTFDSLQITTSQIYMGVDQGSSFNATVDVPMRANPDATPSVMVSNFQGVVTVTWPTDSGMMTDQLQSSNALPLSDFQN